MNAQQYDEKYINGRAEMARKIITLMNPNNINEERKKNAVKLIRAKLREQKNGGAFIDNDIDEEQKEREPEPEQEQDLQQEQILDVQAVQEEEINESKIQEESQPQEALVQAEANNNDEEQQQQPNYDQEEIKQRSLDMPSELDIPPPQSFRSNYHRNINNINYVANDLSEEDSSLRSSNQFRSKERKWASYDRFSDVKNGKEIKEANHDDHNDDDDDDHVPFVARYMRFSGSFKPNKPSTVAKDSSRTLPQDAATVAQSRPNLRQKFQISKLKLDCESLCKSLGRELKDLITDDAPKEEWQNLYNDLLADNKKKNTKTAYKDVLDWASLGVQQFTETLRPMGFRGKGFSKMIRETNDFDADFEELYEQNEIPFFRNIPPTANIVNKYIKKFTENHWNVLKEEPEEKPVEPAAPPMPPRPVSVAASSDQKVQQQQQHVPVPSASNTTKKQKDIKRPKAAAQPQAQNQWDPAMMQQYAMFYNQMMQQQYQMYMMQQMQQQNQRQPSTNFNFPQPTQMMMQQPQAPMQQQQPLHTLTQQTQQPQMQQPSQTPQTQPIITEPVQQSNTAANPLISQSGREEYFRKLKQEKMAAALKR